MLALLETAAGFALFRVRNGSLLEVKDVESLQEAFNSAEKTKNIIELHAFSRFKDNKQATEETLALIDGNMGKGLRRFLKKQLAAEGEAAKLLVADKNLGSAIKSKFNAEILFSPQTHEILRGIRQHIAELLDGIDEKGNLKF